MESILKLDKVILIKEFGKMKMVGEEYEVANVLDDSLVLRHGRTKVAMGVITFKDFDTYFRKVEEFKGWTQWMNVADDNGNVVFKYRTNGKKTQVETIEGKNETCRGEACCNFAFSDEFNLSFGIKLAYLRCLQKTDRKKRRELWDNLQKLDSEIIERKNLMSRMLKSLDKEEKVDTE